MTRLALYGGSFNPPHAAHQLVALYVLETQPIDELWFVPTYTHPFGKALAPYDDRIAMCELVAAPLGARAKVSRAEEELAHRPGFVASRTLDLVDHVRELGHAPRLVVGTDILGETHKWYRWADVAARAPLIVIGRTGYAMPDGSMATGVTMPEISATQIRALLATGDTAALEPLLPASVLRYIADRNLYDRS
jgi:nicotinate-nucleotide adenylyltransferase